MNRTRIQRGSNGRLLRQNGRLLYKNESGACCCGGTCEGCPPGSDYCDAISVTLLGVEVTNPNISLNFSPNGTFCIPALDGPCGSIYAGVVGTGTFDEATYDFTLVVVYHDAQDEEGNPLDTNQVSVLLWSDPVPGVARELILFLTGVLGTNYATGGGLTEDYCHRAAVSDAISDEEYDTGYMDGRHGTATINGCCTEE